jgi:hypothetical protein
MDGETEDQELIRLFRETTAEGRAELLEAARQILKEEEQQNDNR